MLSEGRSLESSIRHYHRDAHSLHHASLSNHLGVQHFLRLAIATILLSTTAHAEGPVAVGTPEDLRLRSDYGDCTFEAAERLLNSDQRAFVIAEVAHLACQGEWNSWMEYHLARDPDANAIANMFANVKELYMEGLTEVILEMRAAE